jgi:polysaccharide export outer membrane protein
MTYNNFVTGLCAGCRHVWLAVAVLAPAFAVAQGAAAPQPASAQGAANNPSPAVAPATQVVDPNTYVIGPGDTLQVFVWRNPDLTTSVPVRPDGKISTPLVEDMVAVGKTPAQLARDVEKVLSEYVRSPTVNIIVTLAMGTNSQVQVIGQVTKPGAVPYRAGMKVLDAVLAVQGLTQFAAGNRAKIERTVAGRREEIKVRLERLVNKGDMSQNLDLRPGDVLVVPESRF